ncbi:DHA2 family efflux MFS transporter permease subunit [Azonexus sp.]|jgi:EmrB/QacA subfamily drug resistance transporter|uniref:DHA2 family efflux MFS transporter permease subunit n=1 Tax=Azonexus sp. TaxID=1872668 RepID=UPI00283813A2|nr:DHA2 family efflux MFS transporter permease subunit [Azonexus sp.]MDR1994321.1 DHA2 family efflux MFS transporter permease subunit [Azonexus sp.]
MRLFRPASFDALSAHYGQNYKWIVLFVLSLGTVASVLCTSSFNVAVPALARHFGLGQDHVQWAMTGFLAAMTVSMLPTSWLLDRLGFRTVFLLALGILLLASIAGFLAPTFTLVVVTRILQGVAAGILQPMGTLALMRLFPPEIQGRASGLLIFGIALTPAIAPALGGVLLDRFGWESIFLLGTPFAVIAGLAAIRLLPAPRRIEAKPFDWPGLGWLTLSAIALIECVSSLQHSGLASPWMLGQSLLVVGGAGFYYRHAKRKEQPIINLRLFEQRTFSMGTIVSFAYGFGLYGSTYLIPVFLQNALSFSASSAGMALLPSGIALVAMLPLAGRMADHYAPKWLTVLGLTVFGASFLIFAALGGTISYLAIIAATVIGRIGLGMILPALNLATLRYMEPHQLGQSSVVVSYARQLGGVMGVAIMAVFVEWRETVYGIMPPGIYTAYAQGFLFLALVLALAVLAASFMKREREMNPTAP